MADQAQGVLAPPPLQFQQYHKPHKLQLYFQPLKLHKFHKDNHLCI